MTGSELVGAGLSAQIFVTAEAFRLLLRVSIVPLVASFGSTKYALLVLTPNLGSPIIAFNKTETENAWINEILQTYYGKEFFLGSKVK